MTDGQIHSLDESGVQPLREAQPLQSGFESVLCAKPHHLRDPNQPSPSVAFLHLAVDQTRRYLPLAHVVPSTAQREPLTKVGREPHRSRN